MDFKFYDITIPTPGAYPKPDESSQCFHIHRDTILPTTFRSPERSLTSRFYDQNFVFLHYFSQY
jgi:hypothetical protein